MLKGTRSSLSSQGITVAQLAFQLVVTIVGVYIAIHLQDAADQRMRTRAADRTLAAIHLELGQDEQGIEAIIREQRNLVDAARRLAAAVRNPATEDTVLERLIERELIPSRTFFSRAAAYATLLSAGQLEFVRDQQVRLALAQIYEHDYVRLERNGEVSDGIHDVFRHSIVDYWDYHLHRPIASRENADIVLSNAIHRVVAFSGYYQGLLEQQRAVIQEARGRIADHRDP
jgi:hypothetical protein